MRNHGTIQRRAPLLQLAALTIVVVLGLVLIPGLGAWSSLKLLLTLAALLALASLGPTLAIIVGGIDLSVPGFIVLGAVSVSHLYGALGWPAWLAMTVPVLVAALLGAFIGWICERFHAPSLVVTLGMSAVASGGVVAWVGGSTEGSPPTLLGAFASPGSEIASGIPIPPILAATAVVVVVIAIVLNRSIPGRHLYATGANPVAARLALIPTSHVWTVVFAISAGCSAIVGLLLAGFSGPSATVGDSYLFSGLAAVLIGGTVFGGARGDFTHTVVGALLLTALTTVLIGLRIDPALNQVVFGVLILIVVAASGRVRRLRDRV